eukprot:scaffold10055_cov101-Isochrysis_galbana.AAC.4
MRWHERSARPGGRATPTGVNCLEWSGLPAGNNAAALVVDLWKAWLHLFLRGVRREVDEE